MVSVLGLNRRHKTGLFLTAVVVGVCLLLGVGLRETCGALLLGIALSWALGEHNRALQICLTVAGLLIATGPLLSALIDYSKQFVEYRHQLHKFEAGLADLAKAHPDLSKSLSSTTGKPCLDFSAAGGIPDSGRPCMVVDGQQVPGGRSHPRYATPLPRPPPGLTPLGEMIDLGPTGGIFDADEAKRQGLIVHPTSSIGHEADFRVVKVPEVGDLNLPVVTSSRAFASDLRRQHPEVPRWYIDALTAGVDPVAFNLADPPMAKPAPANLGEVISGNYPLEIVGLTLMVCFGVVIVLDMRHREPRSVPDAQDFTL